MLRFFGEVGNMLGKCLQLVLGEKQLRIVVFGGAVGCVIFCVFSEPKIVYIR